MKSTTLFIGFFFCIFVAQSQIFTKISIPPFASDQGDTRGVSWGDPDGDGDPDLYLTNQSSQANYLYLNNGGTFVKNTTTNLTGFSDNNGGAFWADYDNDGDEDVFIYESTSGTHKLYNNQGALTFSLLTGPISSASGPGRGGAWADYNNDGHLDLYVVMEDNNNNLLFFNNGNGTFTQITSGVLVTDNGKSRGAAWCDYDLDGDMDLVVPNYLQANFLYRNDGGGNFTKITNTPVTTTANSSFGASWGDLNNDGFPDLYISNFKDPNEVYINNGTGGFAQIVNTNISIGSTNTNAAALADVDNDGDLDILAISGEVNCPTGDCTNDLFLNTGSNSVFVAAPQTEPFSVDDDPSQGVALADYDRDGFLDVAVSNRDNFGNYLFKNNGGTNHWVQIKLEGTVSNKQAIGARLRVLTAGGWQNLQVLANSGYRSQSELTAHFGLGTHTLIDSLIIYWPSGLVCKFDQLPVDSLYTFVEGCATCDVEALIENVVQPKCAGSDSVGSFFISGLNGAAPYQFSLNSGAYTNSGSFSNLSPGNYSVSILDSDGCEYDTTIQILIPSPPIQLIVTATGETSFGANDGTAMVMASGGGGAFSYIWSNGATGDFIGNLSPGIYEVTVTDIKNGCSLKDSVEVPGVHSSIGNETFQRQWTVSPNPSQGDFVISWDFKTVVTIIIFDMRGRAVFATEVALDKRSEVVSLNLPNGLYSVVLNSSGLSGVKRLVLK